MPSMDTVRASPAGQSGAAIWLAPMEGLLDHGLRDTLTRVGGIDLCVSEFIRVTDTVLPPRAFTRVVPELRNGSRTVAGVPVRVQLLGSDPVCLAENAASLAELAPAGIDLNFGCPAKTVNRHRGGAVLLDEPELVGRIVAQVRRAVLDSVRAIMLIRAYRIRGHLAADPGADDRLGPGRVVPAGHGRAGGPDRKDRPHHPAAGHRTSQPRDRRGLARGVQPGHRRRLKEQAAMN